MSLPTPPFSPIDQGTISYQSAVSDGAGLLHIKLAGIFNLVVGGLDVIYAIYAFFMGIFMTLVTSGRIGGTTTTMSSVGPWPPTMTNAVLIGIYGGMGLIAVAGAIIKLTAGIKLLRHGKNARTWGYVAGIFGCVQVFGALCCIINLAAGVYTIVAMSLQSSQRAFASIRTPADNTHVFTVNE